jgi:CubicO group peptidase (beta-lactamase class C family)
MVGAILAQRSKMPADRVLAREVFEPAEMKHAGLLVTTAPPGLDLAPMGTIRPQNFFTAGAGYASASDLLAFFEALAGEVLLTAASKALLFDGAAERDNGALGCWAYPFARADGGTTRLVERPGSFGNVRLFTAFFPDDQRAIVAWTGDGVDIARPRSGKGIGLSLARAAIE